VSDTKKEVWSIDVNRMSCLKVVFAEPVTRAEAIDLFHDEDYEDVIDEEDHGVEVVGAR
jgi:hypothetical protein